MTIPTMFEAMGQTFWIDSKVFLMAAPRDDDGYTGVRFSGSYDDLRYMFREIATHLYQAMVITEEQWRAICPEEDTLEH